MMDIVQMNNKKVKVEPEISEEFQKKLNKIRKGKATEYDNIEDMLEDLGLKS
ncbi:MAG: hypothetical protein QMD61_08030 [Methanobacterium sp.]|nr:hypothetical protein [Methanobacterium sp.]